MPEHSAVAPTELPEANPTAVLTVVAFAPLPFFAVVAVGDFAAKALVFTPVTFSVAADAAGGAMSAPQVSAASAASGPFPPGVKARHPTSARGALAGQLHNALRTTIRGFPG